MNLRQQAKILEVHHSTLRKCINGKREWNSELTEGYENLAATTQFYLSVMAGCLEEAIGLLE